MSSSAEGFEMWPFSNKHKAPGQKLVFKGGEEFLEYQCKFGHTELRPKQGLVAVVLDANKEFGTVEPVNVKPDGSQITLIKVTSDDGRF